jgi:hypothetical protein
MPATDREPRARGLPPESYEPIPGESYLPYVPASRFVPELTLKAVVVGILLRMPHSVEPDESPDPPHVGLLRSPAVGAKLDGLAIAAEEFGLVHVELACGRSTRRLNIAGEKLRCGFVALRDARGCGSA